jgi:DNA polymerase I-like protein with 3'-5' exonuclease and polymerase domains
MSSQWCAPVELPDLRHVGIVALDTETKDDGLRLKRGPGWPWRGGYIIGVSVAWHDGNGIRAAYVPLQHPDSQNFNREQVIHWLRDLIAAKVRIVTKNGLYDWGWLWADLGIEMPGAGRLEEIDALATMVDENRLKYSLDALCAWRGFPGKDETLLLEGCAALGLIPPRKRKSFKPQSVLWQLPARFAGLYAETDAIRTLQLFESLDPVLEQEGTRNAYRLECDLLPMVHRMRRRGIRIDIGAAEQVRNLLLSKRDAVLAQISEKLGANTGMDEINGRKWLITTFDRFGIEYPRTEKGNPSFKRGKRGWMQHSQHWLPPLVAAADQLDQYGDNFLQKQIIDHIENGRVYGEIHPHRSDYGGTRSLRFSYSHPPLQQMPKHDEVLAPLIRGVFLPEEGEAWASCDYSQQEFRLVVHFAAQKNLPGAATARDRYSNEPNFDIHAHASELTGGTVTRQDGKTFNFMTIYGAGPETIALQIKKPLAETRMLLDLYSEKMPFITRLADACKNAGQRDGYFTLFNGARRHFNLWYPGGRWEEGAGPCERSEAERRMRDPGHPWYGRQLWRAEGYKALNYLIQSAAAIQTKLWMRACFREGVVPLLQMHDALELSVSSPEVAETAARIGEAIVKLEVPMRVDVNYGRSWGDAKHTWPELHGRSDSRQAAGIDRANGCAVLLPLPAVEPPGPEPQADEAPPWAHICARCKLDPPDGTEHLSAYNDLWLHQRCEDEMLSERLAEEGISDPAPVAEPPPPLQPAKPPPPVPPGGNGPHGGNGQATGHDSKTAAERNTHAEEHAGEPFDDVYLRRQGYRLTNVFNYTLADLALLYQQNRYELPANFKPGKKRPRKQFLPSHQANGVKVFGPTVRRAIYNWPAVMHAAPGSFVFITEGEKNADMLIKAGLLATTVLSHKWTPECVAALTGHHPIILADHDESGKEGAAIAARAQKALAPVAASTRIAPLLHLWKRLPNGAPAPKPNDDVEDWIRHGGDVQQLLDICLEIPAAGAIDGAPFQVRAETEIPRWEWLYGNLLLRGEVAGTCATGGTGKSLLSIVEALALVSGRTLLNEAVTRPLRVILINLEDTRNTMEKRIAGVMRFYELTAADIGDRLIVLGKGEVKIKVARQLRSGDVERNETAIKALTKLMLKHRGDVLSIDSFIRAHKVNENDNSAIQEVVECFEDIAQGANGAVHLWHHTRKPGGEKATIESARGASAFMDACRSGRVLDMMTEKERNELADINPEMLPAPFYFRAFSGKRSFAPPAEQSDWFRRESLTLANGDNVWVAVLWKYPANQDDVPPETVKAIIDEIDQGMPNGSRYSNHHKATARQAWPLVQKHCPGKTERQCRRLIAGWSNRGLLYEERYFDQASRKEQGGLVARKEKEKDTPPGHSGTGDGAGQPC